MDLLTAQLLVATCVAIAFCAPFVALGAWSIARGRQGAPPPASGKNWVFEPHKTNPGDIDMGRYSDPFGANIHDNANELLDRLRRHQRAPS